MKDKAGVDAYVEVRDHDIYKSKVDSKVSIKILEPSQVIIDCLYKNHLELEYEIEHLLSTRCWKQLIERELTEPRSIDEIIKFLGIALSPDKTILQSVSDNVHDCEIKDTIVLNNPRSEHKKEICSFVINQPEEVKREFLSGFEKTIKMLEKMF